MPFQDSQTLWKRKEQIVNITEWPLKVNFLDKSWFSELFTTFLKATWGKRKSKIMQINGKKEERLGWREEKAQLQRFYCILNNRFSETEMPDWSATCQSVNTRNLSLKGVTATPTFVAHGKQTLVEKCTSVSKWKLKRVNGLTSPSLCGTWNKNILCPNVSWS